MSEDRISLAHGNGGRLMRQLIETHFFAAFDEPALAQGLDATPVPATGGDLMMTVDGFTVQPLAFPGGDLGTLAANGTINDLAVCGARPRWLTLSAILEEGLPVNQLSRLVQSFAGAVREAGASVLAGDTKVVPHGQGGGAYLTVTGLGETGRSGLGFDGIRPGDKVLVSGPVGDHGTAVMLAREDFDLRGDVRSDCASVLGLCEAAWAFDGLRFLRDPTRGGLATVANEIAQATGYGVRLFEPRIPLHPATTSVCEMLGFDPYYLACEGRVVAVVAPEEADRLLGAWQTLPEVAQAAEIGEIEESAPRVVLETEIGGERLFDELEDDPLPRIC